MLLPLLARGLIVRRPRVVRHAQAHDLDRRAVTLLQELRDRYGAGPLRLRIPGRRMVVVLDPDHVLRVLEQSPAPFSPATREKRAALAHFQPHGVLISQGQERTERRRLNEEVLDSAAPVHRSAGPMVGVITEEIDRLLQTAQAEGRLTWDAFTDVWWPMVRRIVLGDGARDDDTLTRQVGALRADANWAFLRPRRRRLRAEVDARLRAHLERAEPGSLAASMAGAEPSRRDHPSEQVPQWLFAFDAAAIATYRALAVLATHEDARGRARTEAGEHDLGVPADLPYLRACVLESVRLWPTTPVVLRETTERTRWPGGPVPAGTLVLIHAPFFHRDDQRLPEADRFAPELWEAPRTDADWPLIPFSAGPAECAGRNLVLHVTSTVLARLVSGPDLTLDDAHVLDDPERLPGTLDPFHLTFSVHP